MAHDPLPPVEVVDIDPPEEGELVRVRTGSARAARLWIAVAAVLLLGILAVALTGDDDAAEPASSTVDPLADQGPVSENLVPFERKATSTTVAAPPLVPGSTASLLLVRGGAVDVLDLATGVRRDLAVIAEAAGLVPLRGGVAKANGTATFHPLDGGPTVELGAADVLRPTESDNAVWLVRAAGSSPGLATLVEPDGTVLAGPLEIPPTTEVTAATTHWLVLAAANQTYLLGVDGTLQPVDLSARVASLTRDTFVHVDCDELARCGPAIGGPGGPPRALVEPTTAPYEWGRFAVSSRGERVAVVRSGGGPTVVVVLDNAGARTVEGAVRAPVWLPDDLGLLAVSESGALLHWINDGTTRTLDLEVDAATNLLVVSG